MNSILKTVIATAWVAMFVSCADYHSNLARTLMVHQNEELFRQRAVEFIRFAQRGDVDNLMKFTSRLTLKNSGSNHVRKVYLEQVVPAFRGAVINWNKKGEICEDEFRNAGFTFSGLAHKEASKSFYLDVFGEGGELVITNIRSTPRE
ncbi:MAG: hypothetical protein ABI600_02660 [Luteolibacter sp.]